MITTLLILALSEYYINKNSMNIIMSDIDILSVIYYFKNLFEL